MNKSQKIIPSLFNLVLGILFVIYKGEVVSIAMTIAGVMLVVLAIVSLVKNKIPACVIYAVLAVLVFVAGWLLLKIALYILAAVLLINGITQLWSIITSKKKMSFAKALFLLVLPLFNIIAGICLLFNQGGTIAWVFIVTGIFLIVEGVLGIVALAEGKK